MTDTETIMVTEGKKKTGQIVAIAGASLAGFVIIIYGAFKLYPLTSQIAILTDQVKRNTEAIAHQEEINEDARRELASYQKENDTSLLKLEDITGDNEQRVDRLQNATDENSEWIGGQVVRVTGRIKDHERRDRDIEANTEYRLSQSIDRKDADILELQLQMQLLRELVEQRSDDGS